MLCGMQTACTMRYLSTHPACRQTKRNVVRMRACADCMSYDKHRGMDPACRISAGSFLHASGTTCPITHNSLNPFLYNIHYTACMAGKSALFVSAAKAVRSFDKQRHTQRDLMSWGRKGWKNNMNAG